MCAALIFCSAAALYVPGGEVIPGTCCQTTPHFSTVGDARTLTTTWLSRLNTWLGTSAQVTFGNRAGTNRDSKPASPWAVIYQPALSKITHKAHGMLQILSTSKRAVEERCWCVLNVVLCAEQGGMENKCT